MILLTNYRLNKPHQKKNETRFDKLVLAVQNHFNPENNTEYNRFIFRKKNPTPNIEDFHRELKEAAVMCRFTDRNAEIKSQLITGCLSDKSSPKGTDEPKHAPRRSNKLWQNDRNHIQTNGTDALRKRQLYYKTYHIQ